MVPASLHIPIITKSNCNSPYMSRKSGIWSPGYSEVAITLSQHLRLLHQKTYYTSDADAPEDLLEAVALDCGVPEDS